MESSFQLLISLKTPKSFELFGEFSIGSDRDAAYLLFNSLQGEETPDLTTVLHIDLIENRGVLPKKIFTKSCTLDALGCNTKLIAREVFRQKNLKFYEE